ncbi:dermonecrotic toxin domain-containing protein [Pseudomonas fulva]|uniref:dermonecrotic toxin domain-containing protein n=1 Tax=Pseudomonas fulva TaxID=47880 RepID=UPI0018ABAAF0|nr:DUF6543 domain-containing protein [Pseudomonas fulva]MBF8774511.1 hypothetical protein [Pseudomonas fulva]
MPTSSARSDLIKTFPASALASVPERLAGKGNLLIAAQPALAACTRQLRALFGQAPSLRQTLLDTLQAQLRRDPTHCGLRDGSRQTTLLSFAARLMTNPAFTHPFASWTTWGFAKDSDQAQLNAADWIGYLGPLASTARLRATSGYWAARMPGTAVSRQSYASTLLREHFECSLDIAYGLGKLDTTAWLTARRATPSFAQVQWQPSGAPPQNSVAAIIVEPEPEATGWLLYIPGLTTCIVPFNDLQHLRTWVFQNRHIFWSDPRWPITLGSRDDVLITPLHGDGFSALMAETLAQQEGLIDHHLLQACRTNATDPLDWTDLQAWENQRNTIVPRTLPQHLAAQIAQVGADDAAMAAQEVHFPCLEQHLPIAWRQQRVEQQEALLEGYLAGDTAPTSAKVTLLREQQAAQDLLKTTLDTYLLALPEPVGTAVLQEQAGDKTRRTQIAEDLCQALLAEARLQHTLGELTATHLGWVEHLVDRPEPSLQRPVQVRALAVTSAGQRWVLSGYITVRELPAETAQAHDPTLLLYRPGQRGGLLMFADEPALERSLLATLDGAWPDALLEAAHASDGVPLHERLSNAPTFAFEHPPVDGHFMLHCVDAIAAALPADTPREQARQRLCISEHLARLTAFARLAEKNRSSHFQQTLPRLSHLDARQIAAVAAQIETLQASLHTCANLLASSLQPRDQFARQLLKDYLHTALGVQDAGQITLDIADSVTLSKVVTGQSAIGGAGARDVPVFSTARSDVPLEAFIMVALDEHRRLRLDDATVKFEPANPYLAARLTPARIAALITELDAAGRFETHIVQAYLGLEHETPWQVAWRQETLRAPYEHRLKLLLLSRPAGLDASGQRMLETFYNEQVVAGKASTLAYRALELKPGVAADGSSSSVALSGIALIQGQTGPVLLYMPEAPNGKVISQYPDSAAACEALQDMAMDKAMARYLAEQTLSGDPDEQEQYIHAALKAGFYGFIGMGVARPEPLPAYESRQGMGALIRNHRDTSRSQADLALAAPQVFDHYFFMGLRLVLGILPGASTGLALYDGWQAATAAVTAFEQRNLEEGLMHLVSLLQSLSDAVLTMAPTGAALGKPAITARLLAQQRQRLQPLRQVSGTPHPPHSAFSGYETDLPIGPMTRSSLPQGAGVFEHTSTQQTYITRNAAWYAVEWDASHLTWRLKPQGTRSYRQPVRLSEQGVWETPGRLSGLLVDGGLRGGGGALTTLYNRGVAYWRIAMRAEPRRLTGLDLAHDINDELIRSQSRLAQKQAAYRSAAEAVAEGRQLTDAQRAAYVKARTQLAEELKGSIAFNEQALARLREQRATLTRADYTRFKTLCEENIVEMEVLDMHLVSARFILATDQIKQAHSAIQALTGSTAPTSVAKRLTQNSLAANKEMVLTLLEAERLAVSHQVRRTSLQGSALSAYMTRVQQTGLVLDQANIRIVRASILSISLFKATAVGHVHLGAFMNHFHEQGVALRSTLYSQIQLPQARLSRTQERTFLSQARSRYGRYLNHLTAWEDDFTDLLAPAETSSFRQLMRALIDEIDAHLAKASLARASTDHPPRGPSRPRLFETVDGPLIGNEFVDRGQARMRVNQPNSEQAHTVYVKSEQGQWQQVADEPWMPTPPLPSLLETARARLAAVDQQRASLRRYQKPQTLPVDLEDIAEGHAQQLRFLGESIRRKAGTALNASHLALTQQLEDAATAMRALGRQLRIAQSKASSKPTVAYLEYLIEQQEVELGWSRTLNPKRDRKGNPVEYLEEYRIVDRVSGQPLWYAHFHFRHKPSSGFTRLEAGHLKLASERDLREGAWRAAMTEAQANKLFGSLRPAG